MNMEESVTLKLRKYEALLDEARRVDTLEKENEQLKEENKLLKMQQLDLPDEVKFYDTPYGKIVMINGKQIKLKNGNVQLCNKKNDTPTYTVKLDGSEVYEAVKKATDEFTKELEKEEVLLKQKEDLEVWMKKIREKESNGNIDEKVRLEGLRISSLLKEKYHPHMSVLITSNGVTMLEDYLFAPNN